MVRTCILNALFARIGAWNCKRRQRPIQPARPGFRSPAANPPPQGKEPTGTRPAGRRQNIGGHGRIMHPDRRRERSCRATAKTPARKGSGGKQGPAQKGSLGRKGRPTGTFASRVEVRHRHGGELRRGKLPRQTSASVVLGRAAGVPREICGEPHTVGSRGFREGPSAESRDPTRLPRTATSRRTAQGAAARWPGATPRAKRITGSPLVDIQTGGLECES